MVSESCQDCGVKATTFKDPNDGGLYCYECWIQFYGSPPGPGAAGAAADAAVEPDPEDVKGLPEDAPRGHPAHHAVKYQSAKKVFSFQWQGAGGSRIPFQTTVPAARNSRLAAEVIARACYMKFEQGWTKDKILEWRNQCYSRLGGRPPSLLASEAASQRGSGREATRSRSSHRTPKLAKLAKPQVPAPRVAPKESGKESARSRSHGEAFLPPNHLKLLLDDPQAALPKSQVKIRSQGVAFSQASQLNFRHSQEDFERDGIFKSQERPEERSKVEPAPLVSKQSRSIVSGPGDDAGRCPPHHCCCCRARYEDLSSSTSWRKERHRKGDSERASDAQNRSVFNAGNTGNAGNASMVRSTCNVERAGERPEGRPENKDAELQLKRKRCPQRNIDSIDSIFESQLKKLKEEPPESQHGPESQPTPFIYEPPVVCQEPVSDTLPTPPIEAPTPLPESLASVPLLKMVYETMTTPWCTQPTPKVDAADWLFISDPTPIPPVNDDQDGVIPELTQPTPVPPAPVPSTKPQSQSSQAGDSFADTAIDKGGEGPVERKEAEKAKRKETEPVSGAAGPSDSAFPTVSLDVVPDVVGCTKPVPPVPVMPPVHQKTEARQTPAATAATAAGKKGGELNFAAMLLQRTRAASANRQEFRAPERKNTVAGEDFVTTKSSNLSKLKVFVSERTEQNPESTHPPAQDAPEEVHPFVRATI